MNVRPGLRSAALPGVLFPLPLPLPLPLLLLLPLLLMEGSASATPLVAVSTHAIDFGAAPPGCGQRGPTRVAVADAGDSDLHVTEVAVEAAPMGDFRSGEFSVALPQLPSLLAPGVALSFEVSFLPQALGSH